MSVAQLIIVPISIVSFLLLLSFIVFFHEFGHFSVARMLGIRVDTFSIGFGKPLLRWVDRKGTEWRIAMIPLGGYVKFFGDLNVASQPDPALATPRGGGDDDAPGKSDEAPPKPVTTQFPTGTPGAGMSAEERSVCFHFKPVWARALVVAAGPVANFVLSIAIFASLMVFFGRGVVAPIIGEVTPDSAAAEAGLLAGDRIIFVNGKVIKDFNDVRTIVQLATGDALTIIVDRQGTQVTMVAVPRREEVEDAFGNKVKVGLLGVGSNGEVEFRKYGPVAAIAGATREVGRIITTTIRFIGRLIQGKESVEQLGGPVKMAKYAGQAASIGFSDRISEDVSFGDRLRISLVNWINLAAFISVSIGFLNLLPIPVLDGGHLVYYGYEAVAGRPVGPRVQMIGYQLGLLLLVSFMVLVTWNDISGLLVSTFSSNG